MKKLKLFLAAALMLCSAGAWAQTDVTSTYLTNADFSQGTPVTVGVCTYAADKSKNGTEYANLVPVDGWTAVSSADGKAGGLFAIGGGAWLGGSGFTAPATDSDGNTGVNVLGIVTCWGASVQYTQNLKSALPAGTYTLVLAAYNSGAGQNDVNANYIGFVEEGGTTHYATTKKYNSNTWKYEFITFTLSAETSGYVSLGYKSTNTGSGNMPHLFISGLQLFDGEVDAAAYEAAKEAARNAKELAANKEKLAGSSPTNPSADLLVNGSFDTANSGWTLDNMKYQANQERPTRYVEQWNGSALSGSGSASQTVKNIPAGAYILTGTVNAQLQSDQSLEITGTSIQVNSTSVVTSGVWKDYTVNYVLENDGDISVSFGFDNTNANWVSADGFSLVYLGEYVATTGITADDVEVEQAKTVEIGAAIAPANASYPTLSYASADESVATVDANGVVTGVVSGSTTITITSAEATKVINVTVTAPTYVPESIELSQTAFEFDSKNYTAQLVASVLPTAATQSVVFTTSDASVATVDAEGNITGVSTGTAIITVTSSLDATVSATANVTVSFPEYAPVATTIVLNGAEKTITTIGDNLIKNGAFEYPDAYTGWTVGTGAKMAAAQFTVEEEGGNHYIQSVLHNGSNSAGSLRQAWPIEAGKKYVFGFKIKNVSGSQVNNNEWFRVSLCNANPTAGDGTIVTPYPSYNGEWTDYSVVVDNTESTFTFVQAHFRWLGENGEHTAFDDFFLSEITDITTVGNVQYALDAIPTANIGDGVFQYSQADIDATGANALVDGVATVSDVEAAYNALKALKLNAPAPTQAYNLVFNCEGHSATGNALTLIPNPAQTQGLYGLKYLALANTNLAQAFYFVHTTGNKYKIYAVDAEGNDRYITTQAEGYGTTWYDGIRTIDDASKAMEIEIRPNGEGLYLLWNTGANKAIAHNGNDNNDMFTNNTANFQFAETTKPSIAINTTAAGWGTTILPFAVASLPSGVKAYSVSELSGSSLTLVEVTELEANKPYIIEGAWDETLTGDAQGTALTYTEGLLTGTYVDYTTVGGEYVMQKQGDKVGFFQVGTEDTDAKPVVRANRAYLTTSSPVKAFFFEDAADAIKGVFDGVAAGEIYDLAGRKVQNMQKGNVYIVNGKKVIVK